VTGFFDIATSSLVHADDPKKRRVFEILRAKYAASYEELNLKASKSGMIDYLGYAKAKAEWREYLKSLGMTFDMNEGVLDPSCHLEWEQRYIKMPDDLMDKILALGLP